MINLRAFWYNYSWSRSVAYIDGWIPRFSLLFPFFGYLILVNDQIAQFFEFHHLTGGESYPWSLSAVVRLRFTYYGLFFLGMSNFIYRLAKPYAFRFGSNFVDYTRTALDLFTMSDYVQIHATIREEGHLTPDGKYYTSEWEGFRAAAKNEGEGTDTVVRSGSWEDAKRQYGSLLRSMLRENFFREDIRRRGWLTTCLLFSTVGYLSLALPSIELFAKVTASTFGVISR